MECPFRDKGKAEQFWVLVELYNQHKGHLFLNGKPSSGNSFAASFWAGYEGKTTGIYNFSDSGSKQTVGYVWYKAGQVIRNGENK